MNDGKTRRTPVRTAVSILWSSALTRCTAVNRHGVQCRAEAKHDPDESGVMTRCGRHSAAHAERMRRLHQDPEFNPLVALSEQERAGYSRGEALRAIGRDDLTQEGIDAL